MKRIAVFCGSSSGNLPAYTEAARELGDAMASRGLGLVYGGASIGLMGTIADSALASGGEVIGVIPHAIKAREIAHAGLSELHEVGTMHERKALMESLSDAFIAMPGGFGTLDEMCEIITWAQLGIHRKAMGFLNTEGYFDPFIAFVDHAVESGFIAAKHREMLKVSNTVEELLTQLLN